MSQATYTDAKVATAIDAKSVALSAVSADKSVMLNTLVLLTGLVVLLISSKIVSGF